MVRKLTTHLNSCKSFEQDLQAQGACALRFFDLRLMPSKIKRMCNHFTQLRATNFHAIHIIPIPSSGKIFYGGVLNINVEGGRVQISICL